jgi:hypothetical protein
MPDGKLHKGSLTTLRAPAEKPSMAVECCPTCSAIPSRCSSQHVSSLVSDFDVDYGGEGKYNDVPSQIAELETFLSVTAHETVLRCPTCKRLYLFATSIEDDGAKIYSRKSYERLDT